MKAVMRPRAVWAAASVRRASVMLLAALTALPLTGCSLDGLLDGDEELPPGITDPAVTQSPRGALAAYNGTMAQLRSVFAGEAWAGVGGGGVGGAGSFVAMTGRLTDELDYGTATVVLTLTDDPVDKRTLLTTLSANDFAVRGAYSSLHVLRGQAGQAAALLGRHVSEHPTLAGHMYALQAYGEIFLAELFCSGIPLSTIDFDGDYTYRPGSSTEEVFKHAVALFDTGLTLAADSARFVDLIRVGRGRALLALGQYAAAAAAVGPVSDSYTYAVSYTNTLAARNFTASTTTISGGGGATWRYSVGNFEGSNGLDYRSSADPRTAAVMQAIPNRTVHRPLKYHTAAATPTGANASFNGSSPVVLASGIEARLIEAEAALQAGDTEGWLAKLNGLRQSPAVCGTVRPPTTCPLAALDDPGAAYTNPADADTARVNLLFRERAFWLFLTGHRQGDLRRLIRQYGRDQSQVYPSGTYPTGGFYGADVVVPVPPSEQNLNPLYTGCASTGA